MTLAFKNISVPTRTQIDNKHSNKHDRPVGDDTVDIKTQWNTTEETVV